MNFVATSNNAGSVKRNGFTGLFNWARVFVKWSIALEIRTSDNEGLKVDELFPGKMIEEYLVTRDNLRVVVSLVDLRHEPTQDDIQMYEFLKYYEIPVIVVATKADKIPRGKWNKHESIIKKKLNFDKNDHASLKMKSKFFMNVIIKDQMNTLQCQRKKYGGFVLEINVAVIDIIVR